MALEEYRKKRDFTKSPEPTGEKIPKKKTPKLFFCVQKHLASHLHYDFRDEWAGDVDITTFAPKSVKSEGDFEDILAADTPAIWKSKGAGVKGGEASKMLAGIIEKA